MRAILEAIEAGTLAAEAALAISNNADARALETLKAIIDGRLDLDVIKILRITATPV